MWTIRLHLNTTFIVTERTTDGDSSDPDKKSWTESGAEITPDSEETCEQSPSHVRSTFNSNHQSVAVFEIIYLCILDRECNPFLVLCFQRIETQVVYHIELHVAVNKYPERFLKSPVFYFLRNTKGEMISIITIKHVKASIAHTKSINQDIVTCVLNRDHC